MGLFCLLEGPVTIWKWIESSFCKHSLVNLVPRVLTCTFAELFTLKFSCRLWSQGPRGTVCLELPRPQSMASMEHIMLSISKTFNGTSFAKVRDSSVPLEELFGSY